MMEHLEEIGKCGGIDVGYEYQNYLVLLLSWTWPWSGVWAHTLFIC